MSNLYNWFGFVNNRQSFGTGMTPLMGGIYFTQSILVTPTDYYNTSFSWQLKGKWRTLSVSLGLDDYSTGGACKAQIVFDGVVVYSTPNITYTRVHSVTLDVTGVQNLTFIIDPLGLSYNDNFYMATPILLVPQCFGIWADNSSVCSGSGSCISPDTCQCNTGYQGTQCQYQNSNPYFQPLTNAWNWIGFYNYLNSFGMWTITVNGIQYPNSFGATLYVGTNATFFWNLRGTYGTLDMMVGL